MKTITTNIATQNKNIIRILLGTALILLVPLVAMQFSDEVDWSLLDFAVIASLLIGIGLMYELATRKTRNAKHRIAIGIALLAVLMLIWIELAVGIFDTPFAGS